MSIERTLTDIAIHLKESSEGRETVLQREIKDIETRQMAAELKLAADAGNRLRSYQPKVSGEYKRPYFWMRRGTPPPLYWRRHTARGLFPVRFKQQITVEF